MGERASSRGSSNSWIAFIERVIFGGRLKNGTTVYTHTKINSSILSPTIKGDASELIPINTFR